jgi:hypothetical protein
MKNKKTYNKEIKNYFLTVKNTILPSITTSAIKSMSIYLLNEETSDIDKKIICNYLKIENDNTIFNKIKSIDSDTFKSIRNYLDEGHKTQSFRNEETYNFVAWLIGFNPRPFPKYIENNASKLENEVSKTIFKSKEDCKVEPNNEKVTKENSTVEGVFTNIKQTNLKKKKNTSIVNIVKAKIRQLSFLTFNNKQEIKIDNNADN